MKRAIQNITENLIYEMANGVPFITRATKNV